MIDAGMDLWNLEDSFARALEAIYMKIIDCFLIFPQHWMLFSSLPVEITAKRGVMSATFSETMNTMTHGSYRLASVTGLDSSGRSCCKSV